MKNRALKRIALLTLIACATPMMAVSAIADDRVVFNVYFSGPAPSQGSNYGYYGKFKINNVVTSPPVCMLCPTCSTEMYNEDVKKSIQAGRLKLNTQNSISFMQCNNKSCSSYKTIGTYNFMLTQSGSNYIATPPKPTSPFQYTQGVLCKFHTLKIKLQ